MNSNREKKSNVNNKFLTREEQSVRDKINRKRKKKENHRKSKKP